MWSLQQNIINGKFAGTFFTRNEMPDFGKDQIHVKKRMPTFYTKELGNLASDALQLIKM